MAQITFGDCLISRRCEIEWAPHSPDLNPPDFYLWSYLKDNVYDNNPQAIQELRRAIRGRIRRITVEECVRVIDNFANHIHVFTMLWGSSRAYTGKTMSQKLCGI